MLRGSQSAIAAFAVIAATLTAVAEQEEHGTSSTGEFEWELRGTVDLGKEIWLWPVGHKD